MTEEERYQKLANEKQAALDQSNKTYDDMLNQNTQYSQSVNQYLNNYQNTQNDIYDKQTAFQVELQNQNKEKAEKEFQKEAQASKNAYYDFINPYGVQREIQAQNGLNGTGYSETVKSQAWTTQQNRTAQARAKMQDAKLQFDNAIKEAYLNNDTLKAELALKMLEQKQQEMLRSFNYTSDVAQQRLGNNQNLDSDYTNRYNTLYNQIQQEKATQEAIRQWEAEQAEQARQFNEKMAYQKEQDRIAQQNWEKEYALSQAKLYSSGGSGSRGSSGGSGSGSSGSVNINSNSSGSNIVAQFTDKNGNIHTTYSNGQVKVTPVSQLRSNAPAVTYSDKTYSAKANLNPNSLSSNNAKSFYTKNIQGKSFKEQDLETLLNNAYKNGTLSASDIKSIANLYGL